jgi:hypothetical protein
MTPDPPPSGKACLACDEMVRWIFRDPAGHSRYGAPYVRKLIDLHHTLLAHEEAEIETLKELLTACADHVPHQDCTCVQAARAALRASEEKGK